MLYTIRNHNFFRATGRSWNFPCWRAAATIKGREIGIEAVKSLQATDNTTTLKVRQNLAV